MMQGTYEGVLIAVVHREGKTGNRQDGSEWSQEEAWFALMAQTMDQYPARVKVTGPQASDLSRAENRFVPIQVKGISTKDGTSQIIDCISYELATSGAVA